MTTITRWVPTLLLLSSLAVPSWGQANQGLHPLEQGRMNYDQGHATPNPTPLGEASPEGWILSLSGVLLLGGGLAWAARRGPRK